MQFDMADIDDALPEFRIAEFPLHYLTFILKQSQASLTRVLRPHGLNNQAWRVLASLSEEDGQSIGQIADLTVLDRSNLGRVLDDMERAGLVRRKIDRGDRRAVLIWMTETGRDKYAAARPAVLAIHDRLVNGIEEKDRHALMAMLRQMKANSIYLGGDI